MEFIKMSSKTLGIILGLLLFTNTALAGQALRQGDKGPEVLKLQETLIDLGYMNNRSDGIFGNGTEEALKAFQSEHGLSADGVFGPATQRALTETQTSSTYTVAKGDSLWSLAKKYRTSTSFLAKLNGIREDGILDVGTVLKIPTRATSASRGVSLPDTSKSAVQLMPWDQVSKLIPVGATFTVTDIKTSRQLTVKRRGGDLHADSEPVTSEDADILKDIYGGHWSWDRRSVVVGYNGIRIAASMNGMPHGADSIPGNGFDGMFCIHFLGSRVHETGAIDAAHQAMVRLAARY